MGEIKTILLFDYKIYGLYYLLILDKKYKNLL